MQIWLQFGLCLLVIAVAGYRLCRYADVIAEKTGMTGSWVGIALLATVTSLPELATGISGVAIAKVPNIAVGDALGSCVFNLLLIVLVDVLQREESIYRRATQGHIVAATMGVIMIGFAGFNVLMAGNGTSWSIGHVSLSTPLILVLYLISVRMIHAYETEQLAQLAEKRPARYEALTLREAVSGYVVAALAVVAAGAWLPFVAAALADSMGWGRSFVGTMLVAAVTSAPELAVTIAALRIGALDMAIASLLGSNLFDVLVLAIDDIFYLEGPLWAAVSPVHALTAFTAVMMSGIAVVGLFLRVHSRLFHAIGWASLALFALYVLNTYLLYLHAD